MGLTSMRAKAYRTIGRSFSIIVPAMFIIIALYHHFSQIH
jgi:hypothetical protein